MNKSAPQPLPTTRPRPLPHRTPITQLHRICQPQHILIGQPPPSGRLTILRLTRGPPFPQQVIDRPSGTTLSVSIVRPPDQRLRTRPLRIARRNRTGQRRPQLRTTREQLPPIRAQERPPTSTHAINEHRPHPPISGHHRLRGMHRTITRLPHATGIRHPHMRPHPRRKPLRE